MSISRSGPLAVVAGGEADIKALIPSMPRGRVAYTSSTTGSNTSSTSEIDRTSVTTPVVSGRRYLVIGTCMPFGNAGSQGSIRLRADGTQIAHESVFLDNSTIRYTETLIGEFVAGSTGNITVKFTTQKTGSANFGFQDGVGDHTIEVIDVGT